MSNYRIETHKYSDLDGIMSLPAYQRPLVWSPQQKSNFIDNISSGFPFGSLLLYKYELGEKYTLIDGQQRYTTLQEYAKKPELYYPIEDSPFIEELMEVTGANMLPDDSKESLRAKFIGIAKELIKQEASGQQPANSFLAKRVKEEFAIEGDDSAKSLAMVDIQGKLIKSLNEYVDLDTLDIPCVIFTGDKADLPEVFANVNLGGRKLTKYQVFAAQWDRYVVHLEDSGYSAEILKRTIERYLKLTDNRGGLVIEDFSPEEMMDSCKVTLPEFCHALGELIVEECNACWPNKAVESDDIVDTIGYMTLGIAFGLPPKEIKELPEKFVSAGFENNKAAVEKLLQEIMLEYRRINGVFSKYLRKPGLEDRFETSKTSSQLQFLSFFAALWRLRFGEISSTSSEPLPGYKYKGYEATLNNLFPSFIHDLLTNQWKGSGDTRLGNYINGNLSYIAPVNREKLQIAMSIYLEEIKDSESINIDPTAKTLLAVFANSHSDEYGADKYDYEHLIPRDALNAKKNGAAAYKSFKIPGGNLGNIAFLDSSFNRAKKAKTLFDAIEEMFSLDGSREEVNPGELNAAYLELLAGNPETAKRFMANRAEAIAGRIVDFIASS